MRFINTIGHLSIYFHRVVGNIIPVLFFALDSLCWLQTIVSGTLMNQVHLQIQFMMPHYAPNVTSITGFNIQIEYSVKKQKTTFQFDD